MLAWFVCWTDIYSSSLTLRLCAHFSLSASLLSSHSQSPIHVSSHLLDLSATLPYLYLLPLFLSFSWFQSQSIHPSIHPSSPSAFSHSPSSIFPFHFNLSCLSLSLSPSGRLWPATSLLSPPPSPAGWGQHCCAAHAKRLASDAGWRLNLPSPQRKGEEEGWREAEGWSEWNRDHCCLFF